MGHICIRLPPGKQGHIGSVDGSLAGEEGRISHVDRELSEAGGGDAAHAVVITAIAAAAGATAATAATARRIHTDIPPRKFWWLVATPYSMFEGKQGCLSMPDPIQSPAYRSVPALQQSVAARGGHLGSKAGVLSPKLAQLVGAAPEAYGKTCQIGRSEGCGLPNHRAADGLTQNISLELKKEAVPAGSAIGIEAGEG